jgi:Carboxypeptidase regulatory-like domain
MRSSVIQAVFLGGLGIAAATAQDQTGHIEGVVVDAISHQPVKKAAVSINSMGGGGTGARAIVSGQVEVALRNGGSQSAITDATGSFAFNDLTAGKYQLTVMNQNYPQTLMGGARKTVEVSAGDTTGSVTIELMPGAAISGRILDEDGDPILGCFVQPHPAKNFNQGIPMLRPPVTHDDGSYRVSGIPAGKYILSAQCSEPVFQPRPLSEGPDPPPSAAYPVQYYSAATDVKSAEVVELAAGGEKSGVDFRMRPAPVTHIHGTFANGGTDWHGHSNLQVHLVPIDSSSPRSFFSAGGTEMNEDGSFDIREVFPGSYQLVAFAQDFSNRTKQEAVSAIGGVLRVEVADKPLDVALPLHPAMDISGKVEIERGNNAAFQITPGQINLQLEPADPFGIPSSATQVNDDGSFTFKSVLPGEWRIRLRGPRAFLKSARMGGEDVTTRPMNLTSGAAGALQIVVSTNTATIQGTGPAGEMVFAATGENEPGQGTRAAQVDSNGQFKMEGLAPGQYRIAVGENGATIPDGSQEVTVEEGQTATVEVKPESKP